jgi:8-hydroxy-5-deazaflavin:NADPH oxidoreductase
MKIAILGSGSVATTLAAGFLARGDSVMLGTRSPAKLADWQAQHPQALIGSVDAAAAFGELAVLAVKGSVASALLHQAGTGLAGKVVIDATNPIGDAPPVNGVLNFFTGPNQSLFEQLQREQPALRLVKAFNSVGAHLMVKPQLPGGRPTMFICGNDAGAKTAVTEVLDDFGWDTADMGAAEAARAIEPLCMLWCIPGLARNRWVHAFKLLGPA